MPLKDIRREFTPAASAHVNSTVVFSHSVSRGALAGSAKNWIKKEMPDPAVAKIEILAQEFFRLIIPHQGETRLLHDSATGTHYILSEEVKGFRDLPLIEAENFGNGCYTGLGQVIVGAMFLQEIDLKNGNVGLDDQGRVAKIDGDWCFAEGRFDNVRYGLTTRAIDRLPYPTDFYAFNWLDLIQEDIAYPNSSIINPKLSSAPQFRAEVNQAMLMISLIPDSFINRFVDAYMPAGGERFVELIKNRRQELLVSALQNESFKTYLASPQAEIDTANLIAHMNSFQANDAGPVVPISEHATTAEEVNENLTDLKSMLLYPELLKDNAELLENILSHKVNSDDVMLQNYVDQSQREMFRYGTNPQKLEQIKAELTETLKSVSSAEVVAVKAASQNFRENTRWYTHGKKAKANRIEDALCNTPLHLRGNVISHTGPANKVQEALASHRHLGKSGNVYKKGDQIDIKEAAATFKRLKSEFRKITANNVEKKEEVIDLPRP